MKNYELIKFHNFENCTQWDKPPGPDAVFPAVGERILQGQSAGKCMDSTDADSSFKCWGEWCVGAAE